MKVYPSRVSVFMTFFITLMMGYTGFVVYNSGDIVPIIVIVLAFLFVMAIMFTIRYYIDPETKILKIKVCGLPSGTVDLTQVKRIYKSNSILSAPAASLKRICLDIKAGPDVLVSPCYQQDFLEEIKKINTEIDIEKQLLD